MDRFYAAPMCSPARAALMTGRYPIRFGLARAVIPPWQMSHGLPMEERTLPEALAELPAEGFRKGKMSANVSERKQPAPDVDI